MLNKKAQGLPLQVVIIALLLLVVFVVMVAVFMGGIGRVVPWIEKTTTCSARGGECMEAKDACITEGGSAIKAGCPDENQPGEWCCIKGKQ